MRVLVTAFKAFMMTAYLAVIVCVLTNVLHSTFLSGEKGSINVTRGEYNVALSRWQLQGATDYEMVVEYAASDCGPHEPACGTWTLRVSGGKVSVVGFKSADNPGRPRLSSDEVAFLTVEGLFGEVDKWLDDNALQLNGKTQDYVVQFDPDWGYPTQIFRSERPHEVKGGIAYDYGFQPKMRVTVVSFHAIQSK